MGYIKFKDFETAGQSGFRPRYSIPPAPMEVVADVAGRMPCPKGTARAVFIDFGWPAVLLNPSIYWNKRVDLDPRAQARERAQAPWAVGTAWAHRHTVWESAGPRRAQEAVFGGTRSWEIHLDWILLIGIHRPREPKRLPSSRACSFFPSEWLCLYGFSSVCNDFRARGYTLLKYKLS